MVLALLGKLSFWWLEPKVTFKQYLECVRVIRPGDIIGLRTRRYLTSFLIPGKYKHTAVYVGHGTIIHAVSPKITMMRLGKFLLQYDGFIVLRPHKPFAWKKADRYAFLHLQSPYDFAFIGGNKALYCHELGADFLRAGGAQIPEQTRAWLFEDLQPYCTVVMEV